jgi:hypothetical protein
MAAYHFCERMAKSVSPWEYVITEGDVAEAKAAWLALEAFSASVGRAAAAPPAAPSGERQLSVDDVDELNDAALELRHEVGQMVEQFFRRVDGVTGAAAPPQESGT